MSLEFTLEVFQIVLEIKHECILEMKVGRLSSTFSLAGKENLRAKFTFFEAARQSPTHWPSIKKVGTLISIFIPNEVKNIRNSKESAVLTHLL